MSLERRNFLLKGLSLAAGATALGADKAAASPIVRVPGQAPQPSVEELAPLEVRPESHPLLEDVNSWVSMEEGLREQLEDHSDFLSFNPETGELHVVDTLDQSNVIDRTFSPADTRSLTVTSSPAKNGVAGLLFTYEKRDGVSGFVSIARHLFTGRLESYGEERQEMHEATNPVTDRT